MKYQGSKRSIIKKILPFLLENRKNGQYYVEPFVGGGNSIMHVTGKRIGGDINPYRTLERCAYRERRQASLYIRRV